MNMSQLYEKDFYQWTVETANAIKNKAFDKLDIEHLQEEIESMGASELRELESRLEVLIMHLLKYQYQSNMKTRSWTLTIKEQRRRIREHLQSNPSLKSKITGALNKAYSYSRIRAAKETGLDENIFPNTIRYTLDQILDDSFYPNQQA